jgi:cytochrome c peroxidase
MNNKRKMKKKQKQKQGNAIFHEPQYDMEIRPTEKSYHLPQGEKSDRIKQEAPGKQERDPNLGTESCALYAVLTAPSWKTAVFRHWEYQCCSMR